MKIGQMQAFTALTGIAAPLPIDSINTDDIFPSEAGAKVLSEPEKMGPVCFGSWRWNADGSPKPDFILNRAPYDAAVILVGGRNFGCGSAREQAVWSMVAIGLRCVIASSYSDIYFANCIKNGVLPVALPQGEVDQIVALVGDPARATIAVDLAKQSVTLADGKVYQFAISPYAKERLLLGLDDIDVALSKHMEIGAFAESYAARRPWLAASGPRPA